MGKWQRRGIFAACIIIGLAAGFAAGYFIQKQTRKPKATASTSSTKPKSSSTAPASSATVTPAASSTAPAAAPATQGPVAANPVAAMKAYMLAKGINGTNMLFSVVSASKSDPRWKLDKGTLGSTVSYFLLKNVTGGWAVIDYGPTFTAAQMAADGAPADLAPPK
jgi:hypothetical protein